MRILLGLAILLGLSDITARAQHWPHWRGPSHDGVSAEKNLPDTWSAVCAASGDGADEVVTSGPSADSADAPQRGQRPPGTNFEGRPIVPTVCDNIQTTGISWKLPLPAYSGSTPIIWGDTIFLNVATGTNTGDLELWAIARN